MNSGSTERFDSHKSVLIAARIGLRVLRSHKVTLYVGFTGRESAKARKKKAVGDGV